MTIKNLIAHFWDFRDFWKNISISGKNIIYPEIFRFFLKIFFVFRKNWGMSGGGGRRSGAKAKRRISLPHLAHGNTTSDYLRREVYTECTLARVAFGLINFA
jgi:hypothetical protein